MLAYCFQTPGLKLYKSDRDRALITSEKCLLCPTIPQVWSAWGQILTAFAFIFGLWVVRTEDGSGEMLQDSPSLSSSAEEEQESPPAA